MPAILLTSSGSFDGSDQPVSARVTIQIFSMGGAVWAVMFWPRRTSGRADTKKSRLPSGVTNGASSAWLAAENGATSAAAQVPPSSRARKIAVNALHEGFQ